jgi:hypothetical protein
MDLRDYRRSRSRPQSLQPLQPFANLVPTGERWPHQSAPQRDWRRASTHDSARQRYHQYRKIIRSTSTTLLAAERHERVYAHGAPGGEVAGRETGDHHHTLTSVGTSYGATPKSCRDSTRVAARLASTPTAIPAPSSRRPEPSTIRSTSVRVAPSAMRMPISGSNLQKPSAIHAPIPFPFGDRCCRSPSCDYARALGR